MAVAMFESWPNEYLIFEECGRKKFGLYANLFDM